MPKQFDLVIYGATGFTGQLATQYLGKKAQELGLSLAIAGRDSQKLEALNQQLQQKHSILVADAKQPESIRQLVEQAKVIVSYAGPFSHHGETLIREVARQGRIYLDITGETPFVREMIDRYQELAIQSGARLIPLSGFDSIPGDLMSFEILQAASRRGLSLDFIRHFYQFRAGLNGGTFASMLALAEQGKSKLIFNPFLLVPERQAPLPMGEEIKQTFDPYLQRWSAPFFMSPINAAVVQRSAYLRRLDGSDEKPFYYDERILLSPPLGLLQSKLWQGASHLTMSLTQSKAGRRLLQKIGPKPGQGMEESQRKRCFYRGKIIARTQGLVKVFATMEASGDPSNEITIALSGEASLLACQGAFERDRRGFLTPSYAFGSQLKNRLEAAGFHFQIQVNS